MNIISHRQMYSSVMADYKINGLVNGKHEYKADAYWFLSLWTGGPLDK